MTQTQHLFIALRSDPRFVFDGMTQISSTPVDGERTAPVDEACRLALDTLQPA